MTVAADQSVQQLGRLTDDKDRYDDDENDRSVAVDTRPDVGRAGLVDGTDDFSRRTPRASARRPTLPTAVPLA